jgi:hypothetical protein
VDLRAVAEEVVPVRAVPVEEVGVVVDAAAHVAEGFISRYAEAPICAL